MDPSEFSLLKSRSVYIILVPLVALGLVATALAFVQVRDDAQRGDDRATELATARLAGALNSTVYALRGLDGLAADGRVDAPEFAGFAEDVLEDSLYTALAHVVPVSGADRETFERSRGLPIKDPDGAGGFVPAAERDQYLVVTDVYPRSETTTPILGFDIGGDPVRSSAAELASDTGDPTISDPITLAADARPGLFVTNGIADSNGSTVGFVSSGISIDDVVAAATLDQTSTQDFALEMDGFELTDNQLADEPSRVVDVAGRTFTVTAADDRTANYVVPILIGLSTIALAAAAALAARRERAEMARRQRAAQRYRAIADLGRELAGSPQTTQVLARASERIAGIIGADDSTIITRDDDHSLVYRSVGQEHQWTPVADSVRRCFDERTPLWQEDDRSPGHVLCVRMAGVDGAGIGVLCFSWNGSAGSVQRVEQENAAGVLAELVASALIRTALGDIVAGGVEALNEFTQELARAQRPAQVRRAVERHVPLIMRAGTAQLFVGDEVVPDNVAETATAVVLPLDFNDIDIGALVIDRPDSTDPSAIETQVVDTIVELVEQTLGRTQRAEQEHRTILQLQRNVLGGVKELAGLDIAVRYVPAMSAVGLGGDFYDLVESDGGRRYVVVGDVSGHGPEAVVVMAELKAVINQFLRVDTPLEEVLIHADSVLARRGTYATAIVAEIDPTANRCTLLNAGHPFPIQWSRNGDAVQMEQGHRRLLGLSEVALPTAMPASLEFGPGDLIVFYTDGLVEHRDEPIDEGISRLVVDIDSVNDADVNDVADRLIAARQASSDDLDDDVAVVVLRHAVATGRPSAAAGGIAASKV